MTKRKYQQMAKMLFLASLKNGHLEESKIKNILSGIDIGKMIGKIKLLKIYKRLVQNQLQKEEITIETSQKFTLDNKAQNELFTKTGAIRVNYKINPSIVFGAIVSTGDWIFDNSLSGKLEQITKDL